MYNDSASTVLGIHIRLHLDLHLSTNDLANRVTDVGTHELHN